MTFVQFANDECDYGMGLELGMDLFCYGSHVSKKSPPNLPVPLPHPPHTHTCTLHIQVLAQVGYVFQKELFEVILKQIF